MGDNAAATRDFAVIYNADPNDPARSQVLGHVPDLSRGLR
jgi:hypothetical protein